MYEVIELAAVIASAIYGVQLARQHRMDFVGIFCLAFIVAFGGGTIRDLFLDRHPLFWMREQHYPMIVFGIAILFSLVPRALTSTERFLDIPDALGLGLFSIAGASAAIAAGTSHFNAALLGAVTGTFGGVIGDVICNRIPSLFRPATTLFATCSFAGCWVYFLLNLSPFTEPYSAPIAIGFIVLFRLAAIRQNWTLPHHSPEETKAQP